MTDRELLELAAKAAGIDIAWPNIGSMSCRRTDTWDIWNPLTDDGDALRLSVELLIGIKYFSPCNMPGVPHFGMVELWRELEDDPVYVGWYRPGDDLEQATRRAIVHAAAEIGKSIQ